MPFQFSAPVNTGVPSGLDLNNNQRTTDAEDGWGYGLFPGQYGMAVLSRYPIDEERVHTLRKFRWALMPHALRPQAENGSPYYSDQVWTELRLASKSLWDVPIQTPLGRVHVLASHPTPPAFDGPEDRNGCRNHDEIKLIQYYLEGASFLTDDNGQPAGLTPHDQFVILGDLNCDPVDGDSRPQAILDLLSHPRVAQYAAPTSTGAVTAAAEQGRANARQRGDPALDTGDFNDRAVGNLRIDYALPSNQFEVVASGVFWPDLNEVEPARREAIKQCLAASDHHLVWIDVRLK
jgi:endonuclease/exonuclease/phosphatase family metal-dependent hydrolase